MIYILETIYVIKFMCDCISVEQCLNVWNEDNIIIVDVFAMTLISVFIYVLEMVFIFAHQGDRLVFNAFFFFLLLLLRFFVQFLNLTLQKVKVLEEFYHFLFYEIIL